MNKVNSVDFIVKSFEFCESKSQSNSQPQNRGYAEFCCGNEDSDNYGVPTMYDDSCEDFEKKNESEE